MLSESQGFGIISRDKSVFVDFETLRGFLCVETPASSFSVQSAQDANQYMHVKPAENGIINSASYAKLFEFKLQMHVLRFNDTSFVPCGEGSNWLRMATYDGGAALMMSFSLWSFLKHNSHEGAYGTEGSGYVVLSVDGVPMVILKKVAIDVEELIGFKWNDELAFFSAEPQNFAVPYGTRVNVGEYTLAPYNGVADEYGFVGEKFTKWRVQVSEEFFGVHCLEGKERTFAMIPSVLIQMSCPEGATRHLNHDREEHEDVWARKLVAQLRKLGFHARDVHSEHHGVVILNKTPVEFARHLRSDTAAEQLIIDYNMHHWLASYERTFDNERTAVVANDTYHLATLSAPAQEVVCCV